MEVWDNPELNTMVHAAVKAGRLVEKYFDTGLKPEIKPDGSPVTEADKRSEELIIKILSSKFPDYGFLSEESGESGPKDRRWIIDPLDGTANFTRGVPICAVLIALEVNGRIWSGAVYDIFEEDIFYASGARGAYKNNGRNKLHVSSERDLDKAFLDHSDLKTIRNLGYWQSFGDLIDKADHERAPGGLPSFKRLMCGQVDAYLSAGMAPWDLAPFRVLVEEAGGKFTDLKGKDTIYSGSALATNGFLHGKILAVLNGKTK